MKIAEIAKLLLSILICQLAGIIGSIFTASSIPVWYAFLQKPSFNPPNWIFGPMWISLYILMGISLYLIFRQDLKSKKVRIGLSFFGLQLILNAVWSILFFGLRNPFLALIEIIVLWGAIALTIFQFWRIDKKAAYLLVPYLLWVSFAAVLNFFIWRLNV